MSTHLKHIAAVGWAEKRREGQEVKHTATLLVSIWGKEFIVKQAYQRVVYHRVSQRSLRIKAFQEG
jgi:hypothetical protein